MATQLFIVKRDQDRLFPLPDGRRVETYELPPGAMWRCDCHNEQGWLIMLPSQTGGPEIWCTLAEAAGTGNRWSVSGEPPSITVSPSINCAYPGGWHGFIQNGEITDGSFNT